MFLAACSPNQRRDPAFRQKTQQCKPQKQHQRQPGWQGYLQNRMEHHRRRVKSRRHGGAEEKPQRVKRPAGLKYGLDPHRPHQQIQEGSRLFRRDLQYGQKGLEYQKAQKDGKGVGQSPLHNRRQEPPGDFPAQRT